MARLMEAKNEVFFKDNVLESVHTHICDESECVFEKKTWSTLVVVVGMRRELYQHLRRS